MAQEGGAQETQSAEKKGGRQQADQEVPLKKKRGTLSFGEDLPCLVMSMSNRSTPSTMMAMKEAKMTPKGIWWSGAALELLLWSWEFCSAPGQ